MKDDNNDKCRQYHLHWDVSQGALSVGAMWEGVCQLATPAQLDLFLETLHPDDQEAYSQPSDKEDKHPLSISNVNSDKEFGEWMAHVALVHDRMQTKGSDWFETICKHLTESAVLEETTTKTVFEQESLVKNPHFIKSAIHVLGILWLLDPLEIGSCSCSLLPVPYSLPGHAWTALVGLPIQQQEPSSTTTAPVETYEYTREALSLLRCLLEYPNPHTAAKASTLDDPLQAPPTKVLQVVQSGKTRNDQPEVTLVLGRILSQPTTTSMPETRSHLVDTSNKEMLLMETNVDDMTAEHLAFCVSRLLDAGAADAWVAPIVMKKGRAAHTLSCLCSTTSEKDSSGPTLQETLFGVMVQHSTTLGVRMQPVDRWALRRHMLAVQTKWKGSNSSNDGTVDVKVGYYQGKVVSVKPEFDHIQAIALETGLSLQTISEEAVQLARQQLQHETQAAMQS